MQVSDPDLQVVTISLDGVVRIPMTAVAKTAADCFEFGNKIGLDIPARPCVTISTSIRGSALDAT
jgi:hypothetical protein